MTLASRARRAAAIHQVLEEHRATMPTPRTNKYDDTYDATAHTIAYDPQPPATPAPISFDVTQVIGTVVIDPHSPRTAREVAFSIIAAYGDGGRFTFPNPDGTITSVTVEHIVDHALAPAPR